MARLVTVVRAVAKAAGRGSKSLRDVSGNNMFYAGITLLFLMDPAVIGFFGGLIGIVIFLPSSGDPLTAVPRERLLLWPLTARERFALRAVSPFLNPVAWIVFALLIWKRIAWGLWAFVAGIFLAGFIGSSFGAPRIRIPRLRGGPTVQLARKDLRQMLAPLDLYCGLLVAVPAAFLRLAGKLPDAAHVPLTGLTALILSTTALTLFGLDGESGLTRYWLWPISGWRVLLAKGIAYLLVMLCLTAPLSPDGGLGAGLMALAVGQWVSVKRVAPQARWRFRTSSPYGDSLLQMLAAGAGFGAVTAHGPLWLVACAAIYAGSLIVCGRRLDAAGTLHLL
ncbi:MAG: hypothetical protein R2729_02455 [Bryobacteraceae bacterium]